MTTNRTVGIVRLSVVLLLWVGGSTALGEQRRLWIPGPREATRLDQFDLVTRELTTLETFSGEPEDLAICPDGQVYVVVGPNLLHHLDRSTGKSISSCVLATDGRPLYMGCKSDGRLLIVSEGALGTIKEFGTDCTDCAVWPATGLTFPRLITRSPNGTVVLEDLDSSSNTSLVECYNDGTYKREVIPRTSDMIASFSFVRGLNLLVMHRYSHCLKRYTWPESGQATFISDFKCDPNIEHGHIAVHPVDEFVYTTLGTSGCVYGWSSAGEALWNGNPIGACYGGPFYCGRPLVFADLPIPTISGWGGVALAVLTVLAGAVVVGKRRRAAA